VDVLVANLHRARLEPDELNQIKKMVAERAGAGVRDINARIKAANEGRAKNEAERADANRPVDERVVFPVPAQNAELTPVMQRIDSALSAVKGPEPPMRNSSGALCEIRTRHVAGLHTLMSRQEGDGDVVDRIPAPAEPLLPELDVDNTLLAIEQHIRFEHTDKHGVTSNVQLPAPFARTYRTYNLSALPIVTGVATAPLITETGVLATNGLDRERGLYFAMHPMLLRTVPEPGTVSDEDANRAFRFLADDWLCDVSTDQVGMALIIVSALTVLERLLLPERPAFMITAGQRGGGKTTLTNMISLASATCSERPISTISPPISSRRSSAC
jgi:hypothetical protein